jgi:hypothetical protein
MNKYENNNNLNLNLMEKLEKSKQELAEQLKKNENKYILGGNKNDDDRDKKEGLKNNAFDKNRDKNEFTLNSKD